VDQLSAEGVVFRTHVDAGTDISAEDMRRDFDAVCIAAGAAMPRDIAVAGRELRGIHFAMDFLTQQNRRVAGDRLKEERDGEISARRKRVIIIGGGDTGSDCAGTCLRQGARSVRQFELLPQPPAQRAESTPWPLWPMQLRTSHAHEEGCERDWSISTTAFSGKHGKVRRLHAVRVETRMSGDGRAQISPIAGSEFELQADLVLLAMGFVGPARSRLVNDLGVALDARGNIATDDAHRTNVPGVFAAGDARRGASLIVWAIREGRDVADSIHLFLMQREKS
jgi:glutamate synthase (NADPH/NADH) small chain